MHLVIGANGRVGRGVTEELIMAGERPRGFVRAASRAKELFGDRVEIMIGDLNNRSSIVQAMDSVSSVFLCCPVNPKQVQQQNAVIDEAVNSKAYLVKLSGLATFPGSFVDSGRWHAETEHYLATRGVPHTCLHPYFFMQNMDFQLPTIKANGVLESALNSATIAMIHTQDIAAVAANLMRNPDRAAGKTLPLTCGDAITYTQMADLMSEIFDREVVFRHQPLHKLEANLRQSGMPDWHIRIILQFNRAFDEGYGSEVCANVEDIIGRAPLSFRYYLKTASISERDPNPFPS